MGIEMKQIMKPWGYEEIIEANDKYVLKRLFMKKNHRCSLQFHRLKQETVIVVMGTLSVQVGEAVTNLHSQILSPGDFVTLEPGVIHRMSAIEDCVYLEASTPELDDVVRIADDYNR
jgi:mannose-6-phosphate isomerase